MHFMHKDEALKTIHLFGAETDHDGIRKASLRNWVVILNALTINALLVHLPCSYQFLLLVKQQLKLQSMPLQILGEAKEVFCSP